MIENFPLRFPVYGILVFSPRSSHLLSVFDHPASQKSTVWLAQKKHPGVQKLVGVPRQKPWWEGWQLVEPEYMAEPCPEWNIKITILIYPKQSSPKHAYFVGKQGHRLWYKHSHCGIFAMGREEWYCHLYRNHYATPRAVYLLI